MIPKILGVEVPQDKLDAAMEDLNASLKLIEEKFLQDRSFIAGDHISLADLVAIVEVMQVSWKACMDVFSKIFIFTYEVQVFYKIVFQQAQ